MGAYLQLAFLLQHDVLGDAGHRAEVDEHEEERELALEHDDKSVVVVLGVGRALQPDIDLQRQATGACRAIHHGADRCSTHAVKR